MPAVSAIMERNSKYHGYDNVAPPSPALTNPDMILPYMPGSHSSVPFSTDLLPLITPIDLEANKEAMTSGDTTPKGTVGNPHSNTRPSLPGAWFTEEDISKATREADDRATHSVQSKTTIPAEQNIGGETSEYDGYGLGPYATDVAASTVGEDDGSYMKPTEDLQEIKEDQDSTMHLGRSDLARAVLEEDEDDPTSHAALSLRAEEILANAKRRLIVCPLDEGSGMYAQ